MSYPRIAVNPYDRNPEAIKRNYNVTGVAPHGITQRWVYTVPKKRLFLLEALQLFVIRDTAATTAKVAFAYVTLEGASMLVAAIAGSNNVGDYCNTVLGRSMLLTSERVIACASYDPSTGGNISYFLNMHGTEFDVWPIEYDLFPESLPKPDIQEPGPIVDPKM